MRGLRPIEIGVLSLSILMLAASAAVLIGLSPPAPTVRIETNAAPVVEPLQVVCSHTGEVAVFYRNDEGRVFSEVTGERCVYRPR